MKQHDRLEFNKPLPHQNVNDIKIQLSAVCHLLEHFGWSDAILNHVSARVPNNHEFFMNPYGLMYQEITASSFVTLNLKGQVTDNHAWPVNKAGIILHTAIYEARSDINCIIHTHTPYGVAVSTLECGLLCNDQMAMLFHDSVGYHDFEGVVTGEDEKIRIANDLAKNKCLILRNHGLVATGNTVAEAFWNYYYLEFACKVQILSLSTGMKNNNVSNQTKAHAFLQHEYFCRQTAPTNLEDGPGNFDTMLQALMRMLDRKGVPYKN